MKTSPPLYKNVLGLVFLLLLLPSLAYAQSDTRFWFAAPDVASGHGDRPIRIVVSAFDQPAIVTITQPANLAFPTYIVNVPANTSQIVDITASINLVETPFDTPAPAAPQVSRTGILIESTAKITAYYEVNRDRNPDIFALKGRNGLGTDFYVPFQDRWRHQPNLNPTGRSGFVVVATEDNTEVRITPTRNLDGGQTVADGTFTVMLNRGETYVGSVDQPIAGAFPSGSRIQSDKPIAVTKFSDSIRTDEPAGCHDLAGDQLVPVNILGREYIVLRGLLNGVELIVITATAANTEVRVDGTLVATLNAGQTHTHHLPASQARAFVTTTEPAYVGHYAGFGCEVGFAILPPVDCTGSLTTRIVRSTNENFTINLMTRGTAGNFDFTNNFTIRVNGVIEFQPAALGGPVFPATFTQVGTSDYYGTQYTFSAAQVPAGAVVTVESTTITPVTDEAGLFHLGFVNGGSNSGTRYGYFSDFRALELGDDININYGTNTTITADIQATNFRWLSDGSQVQNGPSNSYTVTNIQRRQTIQVQATVGSCVLVSEICVGTNEYVWDGSIIDMNTGFPNIEEPDNWSKPCGESGIPTCDIDVIIPPTPIAQNALTVLNGQTLETRDITILSNGDLDVQDGGRVDVCGDMIHDGNLGMEENSTFRFIGTGRQNYSKGATGNGEFEDLIIASNPAPTNVSTFNNVIGVTILSSSVQDLTVSETGTLRFEKGYILPEGFPITTDPDISRSVVINNPDPNAITGFTTTATGTTDVADYFVAGKLNRAKNATGNYVFPVGLVLQEPSLIQPEPSKNGSTPNTDNNDWFNNTTYGTLPCNPDPNGALRMNNNNEFVDFGGNTGNVGVAGSASRTVEIWARVTDFNGAGLFQFGNDAIVNGDFALVTATSDNDWTIRTNNGFVFELINLPNSLNNWHHYAITYEEASRQLTFYYDGTRIRTYDLPVANSLNTVLTNGYVGRWSGNPGVSLRGELDELKIWSETRTEAQIQASFSQGCAANALQCPQANNLRAYYDFNDGIINGNGTRAIQSRTITCPVPTFTYQRADANFNSANAVDNVTASFKRFTNLPSPATGQTNICNADFDTEPALDNGFWNFSSFDDANNPLPVYAPYSMYLFNRDYGNYTGASTTVMQLDENEDPFAVTPPWIIPTGLCEANTPQFTGRSGFAGNMGFFATAQSPDETLLPIELLFITAKPAENAILVEWATLQEKDNYGFEVFRADENGDFVKIGFVASKQQGQTRQDYQFLDVEVRPNITYYYKLKQIDNNGDFVFTKVVSAKLSDSDMTEEQTNTLYPNPTNDEFTLSLQGKEFRNGKEVEITLINAIGEELEKRTINTQINNRLTFRLGRYPKGMYLLKIVSKTSSMVMKVVKE